MKKLLIGLVALVVLLIAAVLIAPSFIDWNAQKQQITAAVREATGRALTIRGDIDITILPSPALRVEDVRFANVAGATSPDMVQLKEARVSVAFGPLFEGRLAAVVTLVRPIIHLEKLADGSASWNFAAADTAPAGDSTPAASDGSLSQELPLDLKLDSFRIVNGSVSYYDAQSGTVERIEKLNSDISFDSLDGPFRLDGDALLRGIPVTVKASTGTLKAAAPLPISVELSTPGGDATARVRGKLSQPDADASFDGDLNFEAKNTAALIRSLADVSMPAVVAQPFTLEAQLAASKTSVGLTSMAMQLGDARAVGDVQAAFETVPRVTVDIRTNNLNLDALLDGVSAKETSAGKPSPAAGKEAVAGANVPNVKAAEAPGFVLPADIEATLALSAEVVQYNGSVVRGVSLKSALKDGRLAIDEMTAILPGNSNVSVEGAVTAKDGRPNVDLQIGARSDNLREALEWLALDVSNVPADRLRRFSLSAAVTGSPENLTTKKIAMKLDASRLSGGLALVLRERPAFGLRVLIDRFNLDGYLPPAKSAVQRQTSQAAAPAAGEVPADQAEASLATALADAMGLLKDFDANIDATVKSLTVMKTPATDVRVDMTVLNGGLEVRRASVEAFAGVRASVKGKLDGNIEQPAFEMDYDVAVNDQTRLVRFLGSPPALKGRKLGTLGASGRVSGTLDQMTVKTRLRSLGGGVDLDGLLTNPLATPKMSLGIVMKFPEVVNLVQLAAPDYAPAAGKLGPVNLSLQVDGTPDALKFERLTGNIGPVSLRGSGDFVIAQPRPKVRVSMSTSEVLLDLFLPPATRRQSAAPGQSRVIRVATRGAAAQAARWSANPIDVAALQDVDAELALKMSALTKDPYRLGEPELRARLEAGKLTIDQFASAFSTGRLAGSGSLTAAQNGLDVAFDVEAKGVDISDVALALKDYQVRLDPIRFGARVDGPVTI
ncbi:MAG: AsmA family protein, partial [Alphaproteobacteria bacterium]|nr:AsmA family protein [Alphaproteobacteria bacterium]